MNCIIFLTHNFKNEFINTLIKIDTDPNIYKFEVIVLFDNSKTYESSIDEKFKNIKIIKTNKIQTLYDPFAGGHSMYVNYFRTNYENIQKYDYIWIIENDVYYPDSLIHFCNIHDTYNYDLLVAEYGLRDENWYWRYTKCGFNVNLNVGIFGFIMRLSKRMLIHLIDNMDKIYSGYMEVILPHICLEYNYSIQQFLPETRGILYTDQSNPMIKLIENDIINGTRLFIEKKIYHPIKL